MPFEDLLHRSENSGHSGETESGSQEKGSRMSRFRGALRRIFHRKPAGNSDVAQAQAEPQRVKMYQRKKALKRKAGAGRRMLTSVEQPMPMGSRDDVARKLVRKKTKVVKKRRVVEKTAPLRSGGRAVPASLPAANISGPRKMKRKMKRRLDQPHIPQYTGSGEFSSPF